MKSKETIFIIVMFILIMTSCKKTKLEGEYTNLSGTWKWYSGWSDNGNINLKLDLLEKGKYKLYNGNDKIDFGRLVEKNSRLKFISDRLFNKGTFSDNEHTIVSIKEDSLVIGSDDTFDYPTSYYVKNK